jgi:hypothetical protein
MGQCHFEANSFPPGGRLGRGFLEMKGKQLFLYPFEGDFVVNEFYFKYIRRKIMGSMIPAIVRIAPLFVIPFLPLIMNNPVTVTVMSARQKISLKYFHHFPGL